MMDIANIDINYIEIFADAYLGVETLFDVEGAQATPKQQKKIRKWLDSYLIDEDIPKKVLAYIDDSKTDGEVLAFLESCYLHIQEHGTWKRQLFEKVAAEFSEDVKNAFLHLFEEMVFCAGFRREADTLILHLDENSAFTRKLILCGVEGSVNADELNFTDAQIVKQEGGYRLVCRAENYQQETQFPVAFSFQQAKVEIDLYRADERLFEETPWNTLAATAYDILEKAKLGPTLLNQHEQALLPLLQEITALSDWGIFSAPRKNQFPALKPYLEKHRLNSLAGLLDAIGQEKSPDALLNKLHRKLNSHTCEPLWRELYGAIASSQEGYGERTSQCDSRQLAEKRTQVQRRLQELGFEGEYPSFFKRGAIKGIRLEESYGMTYFIGMENNAVYHIHCAESLLSGELCIQFLCGTEFLKKGEEPRDAYACCFNENGKRLFKTVEYQDDPEGATLEQMVSIAAKKAQCIKLDKEEKQILYADMPSLWRHFVLMLVVTGGLFASIMTAAAFVLCCLVTVITLGFEEIPGMIAYMPWGLIFGIAFVGFGGAMAIVDIKAKTK